MCVEQIINQFAKRAFRRPLTTVEKTRLSSLFDAGEIDGGYIAGMQMLLKAILANRNFLYLVEYGNPVPGSPGHFRLTSHELAARLSYAICEEPPDDELKAAADSNALVTLAQIENQARRLFTKACAKTSIGRFFEYWLKLQKLESLAKDPTVYPTYDKGMASGMRSEAMRYVDELLWNEDATLVDLFTHQTYWPDPRSASVYDLNDVSQQNPVVMPATRQGILNHAGVLTVTADFSETSPVHRGIFVLEQILCEELGNPPEDVVITVPLPDPNLSTRERFAEHSANGQCSACHSKIDPIGFAFEDFDAIGRYRTLDNNRAVDASGGIPAIGIADGSINGGAEASQAIGQSELATTCFAKQWLRFSLGRKEHPLDAETLENIKQKLQSDSLLEGLISITSSYSFQHRTEAP